MRRLLSLRYRVHDAIDEIASLVEEAHEIAARKWVLLLSHVEPVGRVARELDDVRRGLARVVFDGVRGTNRGLQALVDRSIELVEDALDRKATRCRACRSYLSARVKNGSDTSMR
jgi:hypothetical protein